MYEKKAWWIVVFMAVLMAVPTFAQESSYVDPELLNVEKIIQDEQLDDNYQLVRLYIFLAIKKGAEFEAYVCRGGEDKDQDSKTVVEEPNDLAEYQKLTTFSKDLKIEKDHHICYITALPHFDELFPDAHNPFANDGIIEVNTSVLAKDTKYLEGSTSLPLVDAVRGETVGIERYIAFYTKAIVKEAIKDKDGKDTGQIKESIGPDIGSYGFIFMQLEKPEK